MLYFIPTPIGNLEDITLRSLRLFKELDFFICEDTRTFKNLLRFYEIDFSDKKLYSYTSYTSPKKKDFLIELVKNNNVWIVSEAWTPWISDPGKEFIKYSWEYNLQFEVIPWASAINLSIVWSCFDTSNFLFLWFIPKKKWRQKLLKYILTSEYPIFFYESVYRVEKLLNELKSYWFNWKVAIFRELTKKFEQKLCEDIDGILSKLSTWELVLKGEFVIWLKNE